MFIEQPPSWFRRLMYTDSFWRIPSQPKCVYLTFDDGPTPEVTPWVLDVLKKYGVRATFFCVGDNVARYRPLFEQIKAEDHHVGNHTMNHIVAFKYGKKAYLANVEKANMLIQSQLFRPPHGWLRWGQARLLQKKYRIIMWDIVTRDYSSRLNAEEVYQNVVRKTRNGSIITFHDTTKSWHNIQEALPRSIEWLLEQGYHFKRL
jgi:peptidoglycan/xylan/chitin deacetylase (PgdA/CDA1 family)